MDATILRIINIKVRDSCSRPICGLIISLSLSIISMVILHSFSMTGYLASTAFRCQVPSLSFLVLDSRYMETT